MAEDRILTSHVGSLVRPKEFTKLLRERKAGREVKDFDVALRAAVRDVVAKQVQVGLDIVSDGEFGKTLGWEQYVIDRLKGFADAPPRLDNAAPVIPQWGDFKQFGEFYAELFPSEGYEERAFRCTGPISYAGQSALQRDIDNLTALQDGGGVHRRHGGGAAGGVSNGSRCGTAPANR